MRRHVIIAITFFGGLFYLLEFVLPGHAPQPASQPAGVATRPVAAGTQPATQPAAPAKRPAAENTNSKDRQNVLTPWLPDVAKFLLIVGTMAFLLGPINLVRGHLKTLIRGGEGWVGSIAFMAFLVMGLTAASFKTKDDAAAKTAKPPQVTSRPASGPASAPASAPTSAPVAAKAPPKPGTVFDVLYDALIFGVSTAFFASSMALLAFYLVSAAHRAFRLNTVESGLMMVAAVIVLLGQVPVGDWLTYWLPEFLQLRTWAQWTLMFPNAGVQRAVLIGASGGAIAAAVRHWLSLGRRSE